MNADSRSILSYYGEDAKVYIFRLGLPLDVRGNFICGLEIALIAMLQFRFLNTPLSEGWIIGAGVIGFVALRYFLLRLKYPIVEPILLGQDHMVIPACLLNNKPKRIIPLEDIRSVKFFFSKRKGGGRNLTSLDVNAAPDNNFRINWLMADLRKIQIYFEDNQVKYTLNLGRNILLFFGIILFLVVSLIGILASIH